MTALMTAEVTRLLNAWQDAPQARPQNISIRPQAAARPALTTRPIVSCFDPDEETKKDGGTRKFVTDKPKTEQPEPEKTTLSDLLPPSPAAPRLAPGPFRCLGELRPGNFVYLYHRPDADAPGGFQKAPSYRLHVRGDQPLSCTCPDHSLTHRADVRYECKHMRALARQLAPAHSPGSVPAAWLIGPGTDPFDCETVIWQMTDGRAA